MKNKYLIAIFIFSMILTFFGALLKIMHFEFGGITGNLVLTIGMLLEAISLFMIIIKLISSKKVNEFLNK
ncbi:GldL-related protein [Flavobacterium psychrotolerans]|uniref:GldL-related protein n=1 Tax=Flavobacterium psychrotolerans TaxID=2169410 RepID=UPI001AA09F9D|nr:hypothetical protein [Flavobacterium psychrotolerans]